MDCGPGSTDRINSFALVSYVPGRLGEYLDRLRRELVAGCTAHSHVTVLPPRPLSINAEEAASVVRSNLEQFPTFSAEMMGVRIFPVTDVIYIDIGLGRKDVIEIHDRLNRNGLAFQEPYTFCPHITLAQAIPPDQLPGCVELARRRWDEWSGPKSYVIDTLTLVQNTTGNNWVNLTSCELAEPAIHV